MHTPPFRISLSIVLWRVRSGWFDQPDNVGSRTSSKLGVKWNEGRICLVFLLLAYALHTCAYIFTVYRPCSPRWYAKVLCVVPILVNHSNPLGLMADLAPTEWWAPGKFPASFFMFLLVLFGSEAFSTRRSPSHFDTMLLWIFNHLKRSFFSLFDSEGCGRC